MEDDDDPERLKNTAISDDEPRKQRIKKEKIHSPKGKRDSAIQGTRLLENRH